MQCNATCYLPHISLWMLTFPHSTYDKLRVKLMQSIKTEQSKFGILIITGYETHLYIEYVRKVADNKPYTQLVQFKHIPPSLVKKSFVSFLPGPARLTAATATW